jgi:hypothetical protein
LFSNIFKSDQKEKVKLYTEGYLNLSLILTVMDWAEEGTTTDIMDIVLTPMVSNLPNELKPLHQKFLAYQKWFESGKSKSAIDSKELKGLFTLQIIENHLSESPDDKPIAFSLLDKTKSDFNEILKAYPGRILSIYGLMVYSLLHSRLIDQKSSDHMEIGYTLLLRAHQRWNELKPKIEKWKLLPITERIFLRNCYLYAARIELLFGQKMNGPLRLLDKAKCREEITDPQCILNQLDFKELVINKEKSITRLLSESIPETKERMVFKENFRKIFPKSYNDPTLVSFRQSLTESKLLSRTLTRSTVNFLTEPIIDFPIKINFLGLFQPVINNIHNEAKNRLNERLSLYGVKALREIPGDGNCQMYSLSDQLCGNLNHSKYIRRTLVKWLQKNSEIPLSNGCTLKDFVHDLSWENYCAKMLKEGEWGDHLTLIAASEVFKTKIIIISSIPGDNFVIDINPTFSQIRDDRTIILSHYAEFHYGSVHLINK